MRKVTLLFQDERDLKRFHSILDCDYIEMNVRKLTIVCECTDEELDIAINAFNATLVDASANTLS